MLKVIFGELTTFQVLKVLFSELITLQVLKVIFGELTTLQVFKVLFSERARSSLNLRLSMIGTPNTLMKHAGYTLCRRLKEAGVIKSNAYHRLNLFELTDILR